MPLSTNSNFAKPDDAFRAIVEAHRGLSNAESADLDAALVLVLANHIGDIDVLRAAIDHAKAAGPAPSARLESRAKAGVAAW